MLTYFPFVSVMKVCDVCIYRLLVG